MDYETSPIWKENYPLQRNNKSGSIEKLTNLLRNLKGTKRLKVYGSIIKEQREDKITERVEAVEEVSESAHENVLYL